MKGLLSTAKEASKTNDKMYSIYTKKTGIPIRLYHKILLVMRLTTVILIASLMQVSAATFGQRITMSQKNIPLKTVLRELTKQSGYGFFYDGKAIGDNQKVTVALSNAEFDEALKSVLTGLSLNYKIDGKIVSIRKIEEPSLLDNLIARFQAIDVSGRVVDADGRGLPGASVSVKGKGNKAVSTGTNGSFYLKGVNEDATLIISFIGYVTKEIKVARELGDVVLELSTSKLDEVQVIAYGTTTQRLSTGNVTTIKADVIEKQPVNNPLLALQGRVPGLFIEQATGFAGTGVKVRIQGENSLKSGNDPLYVIDGMPYISQLLPGGINAYGVNGSSGAGINGNPLSFINPADIESIDVLKDADATAIYGSRAANGAVLITTKKGRAGETKIDLTLQSGRGKVPRKLKLMNTQQYLEMRNEALKNDGITEPAAGPFGDSDLNGNWDTARNIDWQEELIGETAQYHDLQASVSGGSNTTTFLVGVGYHKETDVFPGSFSDQKGSLHFNINNVSLNQKFKIQLSGSYLNDVNKLPTRDLTTDAMNLIPMAPALYTEDGRVNWAPDPSGTSTFFGNPIGQIFNKSKIKSNLLTSNAILSYQILPGLDIQSTLGYNNMLMNNVFKQGLEMSSPEDLPYSTGRSTIFEDNKMSSWSIEPQIAYNRVINGGKVSVLVGATVSQKQSIQQGIFASGFSNDLVMDDILSATNVQANSSFNSLYKYNALFGRINYNWKDKYLLNLTARRDGSSRFGPANQFHNFGAFGAAWVFSEEGTIRDCLQFLSFGKIRASFGTQGNDQIPDYEFLSLYSPVNQTLPYQGIVIYTPKKLTNPYLQWEETKKLQFGLDLGFFRDKLLLNANYYRNRSTNQLSQYVLPNVTGFEFVTRNLNCTIQNVGWEFMLSSGNLHSKNFSWSSSINLTVPKTLLVAYPDLENSTEAKTALVGQPLRAIRVYHFLGVNSVDGIYQFADKNGNPTTTPKDPEDKTVIIDPLPEFYGGLQNTLRYKGIQLDFLFQFTRQVAQNSTLFSGNIIPGRYGFGNGNQPARLMARWQKPGDDTNIQRFTTGFDLGESLATVAGSSDAGWEDASYIRLKNVSLSWQLPEKLAKSAHIRNCTLFMQGQNLWTVTGYSGLDPETKSSQSLPALRVITMGLKVSL